MPAIKASIFSRRNDMKLTANPARYTPTADNRNRIAQRWDAALQIAGKYHDESLGAVMSKPPTKTKPRITRAEQDEIYRRCLAGDAIKAIARDTGRDRGTIHRAMHRLGLRKPTRYCNKGATNDTE
jgi:DNA-binding NarL/FixJ family response regulator